MKTPARLTALAVTLISMGSVASARPMLDCPLRDAPFSLETPLIDIMLSEAAKAAVEREIPGILSKLPPRFAGTTAPSFAAILTLREAFGLLGSGGDRLTAIAPKLAAIPVTDDDRRARCMRYDDDRPGLSFSRGKPRLLLFEKMTGFRDGPSVEAAHAAFVDMASRNGWAIVATDKGGAITPANLRRFDAVIWNNVSGDVLTLTQRRALKDYIEHGGGFVGVHGSAGDPVYFWDWYVDDLIGARFAGHPMNPQFQDARVVVEKAEQPAARGLPAEWTMKDEWYSFKTNPRASGATVIATLDEHSYSPVGMAWQELRMGDHPIAWIKCVGGGRSFYSAIGHRPEAYGNPQYVTMLENAIGWATGAVREGLVCKK